MTNWILNFEYRLLDLVCASAVLLVLVYLACHCIRQPAHRIVVHWAITGALALLTVVCLFSDHPRLYHFGWFNPIPPGREDRRFVPPDQERRLPGRMLTANPAESAAANESPRNEPGDRATLSHSQSANVTPASAAPATLPAVSGFTFADISLSTVLFALYLLGVVLVATRLTKGAWLAFRLRRAARPAPPEYWHILLKVTGTVARPPGLLLSGALPNAFAVGMFRPCILLPTDSLSEAKAGLVGVLCHEWSHLRRGDPWLRVLHSLLLLVLYPNLLYWWLRARIKDDQEFLADAAVAPGDRIPYAKLLQRWAALAAERSVVTPRVLGFLGAAEPSSKLLQRMERLLADDYNIAPIASRRWQWAASVIVLVCAAPLFAVTLSSAPLSASSAPSAAKGDITLAADAPKNEADQPFVPDKVEQARKDETPPTARIALDPPRVTDIFPEIDDPEAPDLAVRDDWPNSVHPEQTREITLPPYGAVRIHGTLHIAEDLDAFRVRVEQPGPLHVTVIPHEIEKRTELVVGWHDTARKRRDSDRDFGSGRAGRTFIRIAQVGADPENWVNIELNTPRDPDKAVPPLGNYVLFVRQPRDDNDFDPETLGIEATPVLLDLRGKGYLAPSIRDGTGGPGIDFPGDRDVFQIRFPRSGTYLITIDGARSGTKTEFFLIAPDLSRHRGHSEAGLAGTTQLEYEPRAPETIYLEVTAADGHSTGDYTVQITGRRGQ